MEFIEKLYSNDLFAPILFSIVGVLSVLFVIVLILALRDAKKSKESVIITEVPEEFDKYSDEQMLADFEAQMKAAEEEKKANVEVPKEEVVSNIDLDDNSFESVSVDTPEILPEDTSKIKVEKEEVASVELERAENDLDEIAATLLKEYQKETSDDEVVEATPISEAQTSPVFVSPDTLPVKEEKVSVELPSISDIPVPQPVRVVQTSSIIDSSKKDSLSLNDIANEEYTIKR